MLFGIIILVRLLFIACMVFIIGYVFGNFSANPALRTITRVASILVIVLFIASNGLFFRVAAFNHHNYRGQNCGWNYADTTINKQ
jgi:hypothetical protein